MEERQRRRAISAGPLGSVVDLGRIDTSELDRRFLDARGELRLMPAEAYNEYAQEMLVAWCVRRAFYLVPTLELVQWLREEVIRGQRAIEICAGGNNLGRFLNIPRTDSYLHVRNLEMMAVNLYYRQAPVIPPADVVELEAMAAISRYKPEVVIGSWVVNYDPNDGSTGGGRHGVREHEVLRQVETYCMVGSTRVHGQKPICALPHEEHALSFLVTRGFDPACDRVFVWGNNP